MKKLVKIIPLMLVLVLLVALLVGCAENYRQTAIPHTAINMADIEGNGTLSVRAGNYVFFVNGFAGQNAPNQFGEVNRGGIARARLNADGSVDPDSAVLIVPKNAFHINPNQGLIVHDGFIYFSTTSIDRDRVGNFRINDMWLMRARFDGTGTEVVRRFDNFQVTYKVANGFVVYQQGSSLRRIDLNARNFPSTLIADDVVGGVHFTDFSTTGNTFSDAVFFTRPNEQEDSTSNHNVIWVYRAGGTARPLIEGDETSFGDRMPENRPNGFNLQIQETVLLENNRIRLFYTREIDGNINPPTVLFSYDFCAELNFDLDEQLEVQFTGDGSSITNIRFHGENKMFAHFNGALFLFERYNGSWVHATRTEILPSTRASQISDIHFVASGTYTIVMVDYFFDSQLMRSNVLRIDSHGTAVNIENPNERAIFATAFHNTWLSPSIIGGNIFFFHGSLLNYTFVSRVPTPTVSANEEPDTIVSISVITNEDMLTIARMS